MDVLQVWVTLKLKFCEVRVKGKFLSKTNVLPLLKSLWCPMMVPLFPPCFFKKSYSMFGRSVPADTRRCFFVQVPPRLPQQRDRAGRQSLRN